MASSSQTELLTHGRVKTFENRLDRYWKNHPMKYDYTVDYGVTRGNDQAITQSDETTEMSKEEEQLLCS